MAGWSPAVQMVGDPTKFLGRLLPNLWMSTWVGKTGPGPWLRKSRNELIAILVPQLRLKSADMALEARRFPDTGVSPTRSLRGLDCSLTAPERLGVEYRAFSGFLGTQTGVSPAVSLCQQGWSGSMTAGAGEWSWFKGYFWVHSQDQSLCACYSIPK